jgi:hypothetical protein
VAGAEDSYRMTVGVPDRRHAKAAPKLWISHGTANSVILSRFWRRISGDDSDLTAPSWLFNENSRGKP